jgi:hypothetical protein
MAAVTNKEMKQLAKEAESQGWVITIRNNSHLKWTSPAGAVVFTSATPGDMNAVNQIRRNLVLNGFVYIHKKERKRR